MIHFTATIQKFGKQGEKTGWTYIIISSALAEQLLQGNRKSFRVKGALDNCQIEKVALLPMGEGDFILPLNSQMRKAIKKPVGEIVKVQIELDSSPINPSAELLECLAEEPEALSFFNRLSKSHQNYFTRWIEGAKTPETKAKRIAQTINALSKSQTINQMAQALKAEKAKFS